MIYIERDKNLKLNILEMKILKRVASFVFDRYRLTQFEKEVLLATLDIGRGETATYKEIAAMVGRPRACRAVGNALNRNPLPIIVPCHRIVACNNRIGGYRYGILVKKVLIGLEALGG
jgi:O-6-methylguanine DNA methyltransferase